MRSAVGYFFMAGCSCELRWRHRLASRRRRRVDDSEPILPRRAESGSTARKPSRMRDAALSPLTANSGSLAAISSSKSATRWLMLGADAANEEIAKRRQTPEQNHGAVLELAVGLGQRGQGDIALAHGRRSAAVDR